MGIHKAVESKDKPLLDDELHLGAFREYKDLHNKLLEIKEKEEYFLSLLKWSRKDLWKDFPGFVRKFGFRYDDFWDYIVFDDWHFRKIIYRWKDKQQRKYNKSGFWYSTYDVYGNGKGGLGSFRFNRYLIYTEGDNLFNEENVFSPKEFFPDERSKENIKKYLSFTDKILHSLNAINSELEWLQRSNTVKDLVHTLFK